VKIRIEDLPFIATGAAFLGTGGGGDPYIGRLLARAAIESHAAPELLPVDELADDANVYTIAMLGAPTVLVEKAACGDDIDLALAKLQAHTGRRADAIIPIEVGGVNSLVPVMAAARSGLPLVDADGMGRAFPEIQMVTYNIHGVSCTPLVVTDEHLNSLLVETGSAKRAEDLVRVCAVEMGCSVMISSYPMTGRQVKDTAVRGTLSLALELGRAIHEGRRKDDPVATLLAALESSSHYAHARVLFEGKITNLERENRGGFAVGVCDLAALQGTDAAQLVFQNEHLMLSNSAGQALAMVPDLICVVDGETAEPVPVEAMKYGQRVKVIGVSAPPILRSEQALAVWGPRAFGLQRDFEPLEELMGLAKS
jgi:DUF917 family protein